MKVAYPRKFNNSMSARALLKQVVLNNRELHLETLNRYRYSEQRSCKDLTEVIENLNGQPPKLVQELSRHVSDEARHAMWLTDLLVDLGVDMGKPPGIFYAEEYERLLGQDAYDPNRNLEDGLITLLVSTNILEKRGCEFFAAHIYVLKQAPQTEENIKIRETIAKILPEEAGHVRWSNRWLAKIAQKSPEHRKKVEQAKRKYAAIEQAAFESGVDIMAGAELRRLNNLLKVANTMPLWERPQYLMQHLAQTLLAPELQMTRIQMAQKTWQQDPQALIEKFVPMFFKGLDNIAL